MSESPKQRSNILRSTAMEPGSEAMQSEAMGSRGVWADAAAYEPYIGRWSRLVGREFVSWLAIPEASSWLDVGCGTGAVSEAIIAAGAAQVTGVDQSEAYMSLAEHMLAGANIRFTRGDALKLAFPDDAFDAAVAGLVLNFLSDAAKAVAEMRRVVRPSGTIAAYVWDYATGMEFLRRFWDVAIVLDPDAVVLDEGRRSRVCTPQPLAELFRDSRLVDVSTTAIVVPTRFENFDSFWQPFLGGQGVVGRYVAGLDETHRSELRERLRLTLRPEADGAIQLCARAWAVRGRPST